MRRTQHLSLVGITVALSMFLAACGGGDKSASDETTTSTRRPATRQSVSPGPGFDGTTITLGVVTPQSGLTGALAGKFLGAPMTRGNQVYWDAVNEAGGVADKYRVKLVVKDSQYDPTVGTQAYESIKNEVVAFQHILGTAVVQAIEPLLAADKVMAAPATLDAEWVGNPNLMPTATSYQLLAINAVDYYLKNGGAGKTICAVAQDDAYGDAGLAGLEYVTKRAKVKVKTAQRVKVLADKTAAVQALKDNNCEMVFAAVLFADVRSLVEVARQLNFTARFILEAPAWQRDFVNLAASADDKDKAFADYLAKNAWIASTGAQWGDTESPGMAKLIASVKKFAPDQRADQYFALGYAQAWAFHQILEVAVRNGDLSPEGVLSASNQVGTLRFEGLLPDFKYGESVAQRVTPKAGSIYAADPTVDGGLRVLAGDYVSDAAKSYVFKP